MTLVLVSVEVLAQVIAAYPRVRLGKGLGHVLKRALIVSDGFRRAAFDLFCREKQRQQILRR